MPWYIFHLNEDKEWVKVKKTCETKEEAKNYALKKKYEYSMISNRPEIYHGGERF